MAKRKRKLKPTQFNKQNRAHKKNLYLKELKKAYESIGCVDAFALIPKSEYDLIYQLRISTPGIIKSNDVDISNEELKTSKLMLLSFLNGLTREVPSTGKKLSLSYILTYIISIYYYYTSLKDRQFKTANTIREIIEQSNDLETFINEAIHCANQAFLYLGIQVSELNQSFFWFSSNFQKKKGLAYNICLNIKVNKFKNERVSVIIDGNRRTLYRIGFSGINGDKEWAYIKACDICESSLMGDIPFPLYIQGHAIHRFRERIDCIEPGYRNFCLNTNFQNIKPRYYNNSLLIEFTTVDGCKLGYFTANVLNGLIVIRTFLFITNTGTPEGKKLEEICGLKKQDKKYWAIDKLSTFNESDIANNTELKNIFIEAGCGDLFKVKESLVSDNEKQKKQALQLLAYMKKDKVREPQLELAG